MLHLHLALMYGVICIYYCTVTDVSLALKIHATGAAFLMLYSLCRHQMKCDDRVIFLLMQWILYIAVGGTALPLWMIVYANWLLLQHIFATAEQRLYSLVAEIGRVVPQFGVENLYYNHKYIRLNLTTNISRHNNNIIKDFVDIRAKGEIPLDMDRDTALLWKLSDNRSILISRYKRSLIMRTVLSILLGLYLLWWSWLLAVWDRYACYVLVQDCLLLIALLHQDYTVQLGLFHFMFATATISLPILSTTMIKQ